MATPTSDELDFYFASKYLVADGGTITQQTADSGTTTTIVDAALTQADDYWNGALIWFDAATSTAALQGQFTHIKDFDAASDTLTLAQTLPAAVATGDTYRLILGGNYRGDTECFGMLADADLPEHDSVTGTNITGLTIKHLSALLGEETLSILYDFSGDTLQLKMGSESYGATLDVSGDVSDGVLYGSDGEKFAIVDVVSASLPGSNQTDTWTLTYPSGTFVPDYEAYETAAGKIRYRLLVVRNGSSTDQMDGLVVWCDKPDGDDTTMAAGATIAAGSSTLTDGSTHPTTSYWLYNSTKDDLRFILTRNGDTINFSDATGGLRGKTAQAWDSADDVEVYPDFDIGLDAPSTDQFENPATEETAPGSVTFSAPSIAASGLSIGVLSANSIYGVWYRETIVQGAKGRTSLIFDTLYQWS